MNDPNDYAGPGTGYRLEGERWQRLQALPHAIDARLVGAAQGTERAVEELVVASLGDDPDEVVIAVGPAFAGALSETIGGLAHRDVLAALVDGVREEGAAAADRARPARRATSPSSPTTARASPAPASPSASSRRAPR